MQECLVRALSIRRREIRGRWDELLRGDRRENPLASPETLAYVIDWTLDKIFAELRGRKAYHGSGVPRDVESLRAHCHCGQNPFLDHFLAGEQALIETLMLVLAEEPSLDPVHRDSAAAELYLVVRGIARIEVESLCSLCKSNNRSTKPSG